MTEIEFPNSNIQVREQAIPATLLGCYRLFTLRAIADR